MVESNLPLELKAVDALLPVHQAQLLTYQKLSRKPLGLLINFDVPLLREGIKRLLCEVGTPQVRQESAEFRLRDGHAIEILRAAREVHETFGPGLLRSAYEECLYYELSLRQVPLSRNFRISLTFHGRPLAVESELSLLIDRRIPVMCISAMAVRQKEVARMLATIRRANWPFGIIINFNVTVFSAGVRLVTLDS